MQPVRFRLPQCVFAAVMVCISACTQAAEPAAETHILFLGNSLTQYNDLPKMISQLAAAGGQGTLRYERHTPGGCTLEKHWNDGKALELIRSRKWDYVVLQEQSKRPLLDTDAMLEYGEKFAAEIRKQGAKPLLYMTWASRDRPDAEQEKIAAAYVELGKRIDAQVAPAGNAWKAALAADGALALHTADGIHPTPAGSYLAACVFYATLYGKSPAGLPGEIGKLTGEQAKALQAIAWNAVQKKDEPAPRILRDISYAEPKNERQTLDVYAPAEGKRRPIVFFIHGGGWKAGDKKSVQDKAKIYLDQGFVFAAANYRLIPHATVPEMAADLAKAIAWVHDHAEEFGGDPDTIVVMGHSAGAQLAALVCTDEKYLTAEKLSLNIIQGCVPIDCSFYDIPKRVADGGETPLALIEQVFGEKTESQRNLSAAAHIAADKKIPPFLILHVASRADTRAQANHLAAKLKDAGIAATVIAAEGKTHGTIHSDLGRPGEPPTVALFEFLASVRKAQQQQKP